MSTESNIDEQTSEAHMADQSHQVRRMYLSDSRYKSIDDHDFRQINFDDQDSSRPTPNLGSLLTTLKKERILIIAGSLRDKRGIARRCGWEFSTFVSDQNPDKQPLQALELLTSSSSSEDFFSMLSNRKDPTVFVLTKVDPSLISGNIDALRSAIMNRHWVVIATGRTRHAWQLDPSLEKGWVEPLDSELFNPGDLQAYLEERLGQPEGVKTFGLDHTENVRHCALQLGSPEAIDAFTEEFARLAPESVISIEDLIAHARSRKQTIDTWFHHRLDSREKNIAIALALFEDVDERIAFGAIEYLMSGSWRKRDTALQFIDYGDLVNIREFFDFEGDSSGLGRLKAIGDETRNALLHAAWRTHRRQITASLSELVRLVLGSIDNKPFEIETLKSDRQGSHFRDAVAETLGEIALLSMEDVEPYLLILIASGRIEAHNVVAAALRRVLRADKRPELFEMLGRWRTDHRTRAFVAKHAENLDKGIVTQRIGAAIAVIAGGLALEDRTDEVDPEILRLIKAYTASNDEVILDRMSRTAIPILCRVHTMQTIDLLPDLLARIGNNWKLTEFFSYGAGFGLGIALRFMRQGLAPILTQWVDEGLAGAQGGFDPKQLTLREKKLSVAAFSMAFVRPVSDITFSGIDQKDVVTPKVAISYLARILELEKHQFVRAIVMEALNILLHNEFEETSLALAKLVEFFTPKERTAFIAQLIDLHCYQRSQQKGGDFIIRVGEYDCPLWYDKKPENTPVQSMVFTWSESTMTSTVSAFVADSIFGIREVIERSQEEKQKKLIEEREEVERQRRETAKAELPKLERHQVTLSFIQRYIITRMATAGCKELRPNVEGLLASLLQRSAEERKEVLDRYRSEKGRSIEQTVKAAKQALIINKLFWPTVIIAMVIFFLTIR